MKEWRSSPVLIVDHGEEARQDEEKKSDRACEEHACLTSSKTQKNTNNLDQQKANPITLDPGWAVWGHPEDLFRAPHLAKQQ